MVLYYWVFEVALELDMLGSLVTSCEALEKGNRLQ
jgi:hypothetical protein